MGETRFELGDCALAVEALKNGHKKDGSWGRLAEYAESIGIAFETLRQYRAVSAAYDEGMRNTFIPWTVHQKLMGEPDRAELVQRKWTPQEIAELKRERRPKVAPKRDERWWKAVQEELAALRRWAENQKVPRGVSALEAKRRAKFIREQNALAEKLAAVLEKYGENPRM